MTAFVLRVLEQSVGTSLLIVLLSLVLRLVGERFTARCRYVIWILALLRLTMVFGVGNLPALVEVRLPALSETTGEAADPLFVLSPEENFAMETGGSGFTMSPPPDFAAKTGSDAALFPSTGGAGADADPSDADPSTPSDRLPLAENHSDGGTLKQKGSAALSLAAVVYFTGAAGFFLWHLAAYLCWTRSILRCAVEPDEGIQRVYQAVCTVKGLKRRPCLLLSPAVQSPAAFGFFRRRIVLPEISFTENSLVGMLSHEVIHCRRGDLFVKWLALAARSLHWFNPLSHWAAFRCELEMELSCDETVLDGCSEQARRVYGACMLDVIRRCRGRRGALTTHFYPGKRMAKARMANILYGSGKRRGRMLIAVCAVLCLLAGFVVSCQVSDAKEGDADRQETENADGTPASALPLDESVPGEESENPTPAEEEEDQTRWAIRSNSSTFDGQLSLTVSPSGEAALRFALPVITETEKGVESFLSKEPILLYSFPAEPEGGEDFGGLIPLCDGRNDDGSWSLYAIGPSSTEEAPAYYRITLTGEEDTVTCGGAEPISAEELCAVVGVPVETVPTTIVSVSSMEELAARKEAGQLSERVYNFYFDLFSGESQIPDYNTVTVPAFTVRFVLPREGGFPSVKGLSVSVFEEAARTSFCVFEVTASELDSLPPGHYAWTVEDRREVMITEGRGKADILAWWEEYEDVPEVQKLHRYIAGCYTYCTPSYGESWSFLAHNYLVNYYGENGLLPLEDYVRHAVEEFGADPDEVRAEAAGMTRNGMVMEGGIGGGWFSRTLDVTEEDGVVTVIEQFYADANCLLKSYKIGYRFAEDGRWLGYDILEQSPYEPYGLWS